MTEKFYTRYMTRERVLAAEAIRAGIAGKIEPGGVRYGSVDGHRAMIPVLPRSRRRCSCCGARATHIGLGDGVALMSGCEMSVRRWVRDGYTEDAKGHG